MKGVPRTCSERAAVLRGTSKATTKERYQYTTSMDIKNMCYKRIQSLIQNQMRHEHSGHTVSSSLLKKEQLIKSWSQVCQTSSRHETSKSVFNSLLLAEDEVPFWLAVEVWTWSH